MVNLSLRKNYTIDCQQRAVQRVCKKQFQECAKGVQSLNKKHPQKASVDVS